MSPRLSWSKLVPGLIVLGLIVAIAAGVLVFAGVGRVRGETLRLHVVTGQVRGLMKGSDVWLGGQRVGAVADIGFLPPGADTTARVVVAMDVSADDAEHIRRNSPVEIRAGGTVIGPIVVYISPGTPASPRVADGDTLRAATRDFETASGRLADATDQIGPITNDVKTVMSHMKNIRGQLPDFSRRPTLSGFDLPRDQVSILMSTSRGALARVDSLRALLASPNGTYGRFKRDSTLGETIASVRDELASLSARMDSTNGGTLGRFSRDSAIVRQVTNAQRAMTELFDDFRRRPSRYIAF